MTAKTKWVIDPGHSQVQFRVKHLAIATVTGHFKTFTGSVTSDPDNFDGAEISFEIDTRTVDTNNPERDKHLRSDAFLRAEEFPKIVFRGVLVQSKDGYQLSGDLTILATTRQIVFSVEHTGAGFGRFGDYRAGFEVTGAVSRKDFGLDFNLVTEMGNLVVGEQVKIHCDVELIRQ
jgi:polyisoprenoid-binding protein YceI